MTELVQPKIGVMIDIETLSKRPNGVITQIAMVGWMLDDPTEFISPYVQSFLPIAPQTDLIPSRHIDGDTVIWWMDQSDSARAGFKQNVSGDFEELPALMRHLIRGFNRMTNDGTTPYEVWARGPQFDLPMIESLLQQVGLSAPWKYDSVRDLRTLMASAGVNPREVPEPIGFVKHDSVWDCKYQIACYAESMKQLRAK